MKTRFISLLAATLLCVTAFESRAQFGIGTSFDAVNVTQSAVRDATGLRSTETRYRFTLDNTLGTPFFLNNITFDPFNLHPDIDLNFDSTEGGFFHSFGSFYSYGTLINGGDFFTSDGFLSRSGTVASTVPVGMYQFDVNFLGGLDDESFDVLATLRYELEVVERIDLTVGGVTSPNSIMTGEMTTVLMTVRNDMTTRDFIVSNQYFINGGLEMGTDDLNLVGFGGNWFDQAIAPGGSRTDTHTTWQAGVEDSPGTYTGELGITGGLHAGDQHSWNMDSPQPSVVVGVVPEPSTWALLALGAAGLAVRFRRGK
jgi:hypothetical protein